MRQKRRQKGFVLLMVVVMLPLLGMAAVVLTSNSRQIFTQTRKHAITAHAQLACESGIDWIQANGTDAVKKDEPVILRIEETEKTITCRIELTSTTDQQSVYIVTGYAEDKRFTDEHSQQVVIEK